MSRYAPSSATESVVIGSGEGAGSRYTIPLAVGGGVIALALVVALMRRS